MQRSATSVQARHIVHSKLSVESSNNREQLVELTVWGTSYENLVASWRGKLNNHHHAEPCLNNGSSRGWSQAQASA